METISFGRDREPRRWRPGWWPRHGWPGRRAWLVVLAAAVTVAAVVLVTTRGHARPAGSASSLPALAPILRGVPAEGARTNLVLGGDNLWRADSQPRAALPGFLVSRLSPLLPRDDAAQTSQIFPVPGGVVALISHVSTGVTYGALGRVVFIPAAKAPARVIARATVIAVGPGGHQVWLQTATQSVDSAVEGAPATFKSPTWAVNVAGLRVSPVLHLPLGLVAATDSGLLTQNLGTGQLQLWNGATGRPARPDIPADAQFPAGASFVAAVRGRVIWDSAACGPSCPLHITDLSTGSDVGIRLPRSWIPVQQTPPPTAAIDASGVRFAFQLDRVDSSGNPVAEDLFVADTATRTLRMIPGGPFSLAVHGTGGPQLIASWDQQGLLWVLATYPGDSGLGYYQLGFWTGAGPLHTFASAPGSPVALSAPGA